MYFDSDGFLTREELLEKIWAERLSPAQRAQCLAEAETRGVTYITLLREEAARHDAAMADPVQREEWLSKCQEIYKREALPFGSDPLLEHLMRVVYSRVEAGPARHLNAM